MKLSKVMLLSSACLFGYADDVYSAVYPAWDVSSRVFMSGIHTYHTHNTLTADSLFSPSALFSNKHDVTLPTQGEDDLLKVASICFITDAGNCSGEKFSNDETSGNGNGNPGDIPDYDTPQEQCQAAGYSVTSCPAGSHGDNPCPADSAYYQKCVCDANMTQTCTKPYYGVGPSCDGKYASCKRDDAKACGDLEYSQTAPCSSVQKPNEKCPYNSTYYDKCVCRSDLVTCTYPQTGVGSSCGGKYASCQCPSSYKSCDCGGAAGATSCTVNGQTTYSSCKKCSDSGSSGGLDYYIWTCPVSSGRSACDKNANYDPAYTCSYLETKSAYYYYRCEHI